MPEIEVALGRLEGKLDAALRALADHRAEDASAFAAVRAEAQGALTAATRDFARRIEEMHRQNRGELTELRGAVTSLATATREIAELRRDILGDGDNPGIAAEVRQLVQLAAQGRGMLRLLAAIGTVMTVLMGAGWYLLGLLHALRR